jgi:hypothetical protein
VEAVILSVIDYIQASTLARKYCSKLKGPVEPPGNIPMLATEISARCQSKFVILAIINDVKTTVRSRKEIAQGLLWCCIRGAKAQEIQNRDCGQRQPGDSTGWTAPKLLGENFAFAHFFLRACLVLVHRSLFV